MHYYLLWAYAAGTIAFAWSWSSHTVNDSIRNEMWTNKKYIVKSVDECDISQKILIQLFNK